MQGALGRIQSRLQVAPIRPCKRLQLWPTCRPFGTLWNLANCVTVVFGASGLPLGTSKLCNCRLWEPLGSLRLCNCRPREHCDPPRPPFTPFGILLDAFVPHLTAFWLTPDPSVRCLTLYNGQQSPYPGHCWPLWVPSSVPLRPSETLF